MQPKKTSEFKRGLNALATQHDWLVEARNPRRGPTECLVVYRKRDGRDERIASFVLRADEREILPGVARAMIRKVSCYEFATLTSDTQHILLLWLRAFFTK